MSSEVFGDEADALRFQDEEMVPNWPKVCLLLRTGHLTESIYMRRTIWIKAMESWVGLGPDDTPLLMRDKSTQEIYRIDLDFP